MEKKKLCVIGDPIEHSLSPVIHNTILKMSGLPYEYGRVQVASSDTADFLARVREEGYAGFNATMPHKEHLVPLMDELDADAQLCGAVNTVVISDGKTRGCNTDGRGFLQMLDANGFNPEKKTVLVLGAGGAAKAVILKLAQAGAARIFVCARTPEKVQPLIELYPMQITACPFDAQTLSDCALFSDLVVNATPLGMKNTAGQFESFAFLDSLSDHAPVCDLIYEPEETEFLRYAREHGHKTMNGLGMLIYQAIFALELFTDTKIEIETVLPHIESALKKEMHP